MNLKSLEITEEEKEALKTYCEYEHTYINLLVSGNIKAVKKFNNDQLDIFSAEYFEKSMDMFGKIYSAMCKYSYGKDMPLTVSRGTTVAEVESLQKDECTKLLSTSSNEESAKAFAGSKVLNHEEIEDSDKKAALIRIRTKNIPMINVNAVLGDDSNHERESEIILSPFIKFKNLKFTSNWNGIEYYDGEAEAQELTTAENMEQLHNEIIGEIGDIPKLIQDYQKHKRGLEMCDAYAQRNDIDNYERGEIEKERKSCYENIRIVETKFNSIKAKMSHYAKGICFETNQKVMQDITEESEHMKSIIGEKSNILLSELNKKTLQLSTCMRNFTEKCEQYKRLSEKLGIDWKSSVSVHTIKNISTNVQIAMSYMADFQGDIGRIEYCESKLEFIEESIKYIQSREEGYNDAKFGVYTRIQLDEKLQRIIREEEIKQIENQQKKLEIKRGGIFNKIFGRDKEIDLEIEQLELRKILLNIKPIHGREDKTINQTVAKILQYRDADGVLPEKLATMENQIRSVFRINDDEVKAQLMDMTQPVALVPVQQERTTIFNRKRRMTKLKEENQAIKQEIQDTNAYGMDKYTIKLKDELIIDVPEDINNKLNQMYKVITSGDRQTLLKR